MSMQTRAILRNRGAERKVFPFLISSGNDRDRSLPYRKRRAQPIRAAWFAA
jgi:hypothetical protein